MAEGLGWIRTLWAMVDERLAELSLKLQRMVRTLRAAVFALVVAILLVLASPVVLFVAPQYFPIAYAVSTVILVIPLVLVTALVALPLRMKSVVRLIDKGYPANAKEIAIRVAARKLHEQSIQTEELLVDTALNEGRKLVERYKAQAAARADDDSQPPATPAPPT